MMGDPEAAAIVLESGARVVLVPLEVTHSALATPEVLARLRGDGTPVAGARLLAQLADLLAYFGAQYLEVFKFAAPPLHDPCAVAYVAAPELFECEDFRVDVELGSALSRGQTVVDVWRQSRRPANCRVAMRMDVPGFWGATIAAAHAAAVAAAARDAADGAPS